MKKVYKGRVYISPKKKRIPKRLTLICFSHKSGDWVCWWRDEKEADREFKKNMKKYKNKRRKKAKESPYIGNFPLLDMFKRGEIKMKKKGRMK